MKTKNIIFNSILVLISVINLSHAARNIILMIGDGMGPSTIGLVQYYSNFVLDKKLAMEKVMDSGNTGYIVNFSSDHLVTDSAAAATAMATGYKTNNLSLGVDPQGKPLETVLEKAQKLGKRVGLVTTDMLTGATPSAFASHIENRNLKEKIPDQFLERKLNVLLGGGEESFVVRSDSRNMVNEFSGKGYTVVKEKDGLKKVDGKKTEFLLGLFAKKEMNYYKDRTPGNPTLPEMTEKAIEILTQDKYGFFLMVEGARIDHANHANSVENSIYDTLEFDSAIETVVKFIEKNSDTLLIITADHETGAPNLTSKTGHKDYPTVNSLREMKGIYWVSNDHTGCPLFLFGIGSGADKLRGLHDNTDIANIIQSEMQIQPMTNKK